MDYCPAEAPKKWVLQERTQSIHNPLNHTEGYLNTTKQPKTTEL